MLFLHLHHRYDFPQKHLEVNDVLLVLLQLRALLFLIHIEIQSVLFEDLHGRLLDEIPQDLLDVALVSGENLEFPRVREVVVLSQFLHEALEETASLVYEFVVIVAYEFFLR